MSRVLLELDRPAAWPTELRAYLEAHHDLFLGWETGQGRPAAAAYDRAIYGLMDGLQPYTITGWHCTRLTDAEVREILRNGMQLPDAKMLGLDPGDDLLQRHLVDRLWFGELGQGRK